MVFGIHTLACPETCHKYNDIALQFIKKFVTDFVFLYSTQFVMYNVHSFNSPMFVTIHGQLDTFSSLRYDNYLHESFNRIKEKHYNDTLQKLPQYPSVLKELENNTPFLLFNANEKIILQYSNIQINILKEKYKYLMLKNNSIVSVSSIVKAFNKLVHFIVKKFTDIINSDPILNTHYSEIRVNTLNVTRLAAYPMSFVLI